MQVTTVHQFREWLARSKPGDKFVYHVGLLLADRHAYNKADSNPVMKAIADDLRELADHVWETAGMTWDKRLGLDGAWTQRSPHPITLVQHRILSGFEYIAVRT